MISLLISAQHATSHSTVRELLTDLSTRYAVDFAIDPVLLNDTLRISLDDNAQLVDWLSGMYDASGYSYLIIDNNKVLLRRDNSVSGDTLLHGIVFASDTRTPLSLASVSVVGTSQGCVTQEDGTFDLRIDRSLADGNIRIDYLGYQPLIVPCHELIDGTLTLHLRPNSIALRQVTIFVTRPDVSIDNEAQFYRQTYDALDLGYGQNNPFASQYQNLTGPRRPGSRQTLGIRGSEGDQVLLMMDRLPIYQTGHFNTLFEVYNPMYFRSMELYKNNLPIEYGGRTGGMLKLNSTTDTSERHIAVTSDILQSGIAVALPTGAHGMVKLGGRISYSSETYEAISEIPRESQSRDTDMQFHFGESVLSAVRPDYDYKDLNFGTRQRLSESWDLAADAYLGSDHFLLSDMTSRNIHIPLGGNVVVTQMINNPDDRTYGGGALSLLHHLDSRRDLSIEAYVSRFDRTYQMDYQIHDQFGMQERISEIHTMFSNAVTTSGARLLLDESETYKVGLDLQRHEISLTGDEGGIRYVDQAETAMELTAFAESKFTVSELLILFPGARVTYLTSTDKLLLQPSVRLFARISPLIELKASASRSAQVVQDINVENRLGRNLEFYTLPNAAMHVPVQMANKFMIGSSYSQDNWTIDVELFHRYTDGLTAVVAQRPDPRESGADPRTYYSHITGEGWVTGADVSLYYDGRTYSGSLLYTLSRTQHRFDALYRGEKYTPDTDRRHQIAFAQRIRLGKYNMNSGFTYISGVEFTSFNSLNGRPGRNELPRSETVSALPAYVSLDLSVGFHLVSRDHSDIVLNAGVLNLLNRSNVSFVQQPGQVGMEGIGQQLSLLNRIELPGRTYQISIVYRGVWQKVKD